METVTALQALSKENPSVTMESHHKGDINPCFVIFLSKPELAVAQIFELLVMWDPLMLLQYHVILKIEISMY